jgi:hypothetical protein
MKFRDLSVGDKFVFAEEGSNRFEVYVKKSQRMYETVSQSPHWYRDSKTGKITEVMQPMVLRVGTINVTVRPVDE